MPKQIEKEAIKHLPLYLDKVSSDDDYLSGKRIGFESGFVDGAQWRINSVWHNISEKPKIGRKLLVDLGYDNCDFDYLCNDCFDWRYYADKKGIIRWAYIVDLLPEKKGGSQ